MNSLFDRLRELIQTFRPAQGGSVPIIFALALIPIFGAVGAAVDYSRANSIKAKLQTAADAAVLAAAAGGDQTDRARADLGVATFNANFNSMVNAKVLTVVPKITVANGIVTAAVNGQLNTAIVGVFGISTINVSVTSKARTSNASACVLALQKTNDGIFLNGDSAINSDCGLYANSTSSNALDANGDSTVKATSICVVGGYKKDAQAILKPTPTKGCSSMADPLASLPIPPEATNGCLQNGYKVNSGGYANLSPGVYCGGIDIGSSAQVTFAPGAYIIRDGEFKIGSSAKVTGSNVFFYLTGSNARFDMGSSSQINFTAPNSGAYKGIVFFQSRTANTAENKFGSSSTSVLQGTVYVPNGTVEINCNGTVGASGDYTVWVVKRLQLDSHATLQVKSNYAGSSTPLPDAVSAVANGKGAYLIQ